VAFVHDGYRPQQKAFVGTRCICIVFVPMFFLQGVARFLFMPLAEAVVFAMLASCVLSSTLVPTLVMWLYRRPEEHGHGVEPVATVAQTSSRQGVATPGALGQAERLRIGNPRYSRLETCVASGGWVIFLALALLAGCAVGPDYHGSPAVATMPAAYAGATNEWKIAKPVADLPKGPWWEILGDAELNRLEAQAAEANQQLQLAVARFAQARASADVALGFVSAPWRGFRRDAPAGLRESPQ
jgi:hypothetical protein